MKDAYPELESQREFIEKMVGLEEERFRSTLTVGLNKLDEVFSAAKGSMPEYKTLARLYDTFGTPRDLIRVGDIACGRRWFPHWILSCTTDPVAAAEIERLRSSQEPIASKWTQLVPPIMLKAMADASSCRGGTPI